MADSLTWGMTAAPRPGDNSRVARLGEWTTVAAAEYRRLIDLVYWPYVGAALLGCAALIEVTVRGANLNVTTPFALAIALPVTLPLALARAQPVIAAALIGLATTLLVMANLAIPTAGLIALIIGCYLAGRHGRRRSVSAVGVLLAAAALLSVTQPGVNSRAYSLLLLMSAGGAALVGAARQADALAASRDTTDRDLAGARLEHAARGERARIARELHDVVAHHISLISAQAEAARLMTPGMPTDGANKLSVIGDTARAALTDMRRLLGVLREDASREPTRQPQPGLQELNELLDQTRRISTASTRLIVSGSGYIRALPPAIELAAYRIVQEALTNARRHAPGAAVDVEMQYRPDDLRIRVWDTGPGYVATGHPSGHGLTGMHERAAAVGGRLHAGSATTGGFLVEVVLPTTGHTA